MQPVRSAIDHVLTLVGDSPLAGVLVLRGSVTLLAWAGAAARQPGDLDFVVRPPEIVPQDRWWPYPYVDKDLYDAVLLAERADISGHFTAGTLAEIGDHPSLSGGVQRWVDRLRRALVG